MKVIKFMLACIIVLLLLGIYIIIDTSSKRMSVIPNVSNPELDNDLQEDRQLPNVAESYNDDDMDLEISYNGDEEDKMVTCKACAGTGHDINKYADCKLCNGAKQMLKSEMDGYYEKWANEVVDCSICDGTGMSYEYRATNALNPLDIIVNVPPGYYDCKVCNGKKKGTRAELLKNFKAAQQVYGPDL